MAAGDAPAPGRGAPSRPLPPLRSRDVRTAMAVAALSTALAAWGLPGGDPTGAELLWRHAEATAPGDLADPVYVEASRELARIRPWQEGYTEARERLARVEAARSGALR